MCNKLTNCTCARATEQFKYFPLSVENCPEQQNTLWFKNTTTVKDWYLADAFIQSDIQTTCIDRQKNPGQLLARQRRKPHLNYIYKNSNIIQSTYLHGLMTELSLMYLTFLHVNLYTYNEIQLWQKLSVIKGIWENYNMGITSINSLTGIWWKNEKKKRKKKSCQRFHIHKSQSKCDHFGLRFDLCSGFNLVYHTMKRQYDLWSTYLHDHN